MHAPDTSAVRLATTRTPSDQRFRESITVRTGPLTSRLANGDRLRAFQQLVRRAHRKPGWMYDAQREEQRRSLPDEREYEAVCEGIAAGYVDERDLATFFAAKYLIYRGLIRGTADSAPTYCDATREMAEALEAIAIARANPTDENKQRAALEGTEAVITLHAHVDALRAS